MNAFQKTFYLFLLLAGLFAASQAGCQQVRNGRETQAPATQQSSTQSEQTKTPIPMKTIIVDVRTPEEWQFDGHAPCSVNYPLGPEFAAKVDSLKAYDKVVLVCRSGARAGSAKALLESAGFKNVENKGPWQNIQCN
ncbi:MAG: rhodanese-like domain-containing protein [Bacteroidia bacterium]